MTERTESKDEAFWRRQEKRREKQFGQPCCTQSGMSWTMIDMPGNFAVVIHGEYDCVNCFHHHIGRSAVQYYSTRLTEEMLTTGRTHEALRACLELIAEEQKPDVVVVLGTCPVEVIGDQFLPVVEDVSQRTGIPMVGLRTSGLALSSQQQMLDWLFKTLASLPPAPPVDRYWQRQVALMAMDVLFGFHAGNRRPEDVLASLRDLPTPQLDGVRVNLVGLPGVEGVVPEPMVVLGQAGVEVNGIYPSGASLTEWRAIRHAQHTFVGDRSVYPRLIKVLEHDHGQQIHEVPLPIGLGATRRLYEAVAAATGRSDDLGTRLGPLYAAAEEALAAARRELSGKTVGVTVRMHANYHADTVAYEGLGEVEALQEMGLKVHLFVQGAPEAEGSYREALAGRAGDLPITVFGGPWILAQHLREEGVALVVASDTVRNEARQAGVPLLPSGSLQPYLGAVAANVERVRQAARGGR